MILLVGCGDVADSYPDPDPAGDERDEPVMRARPCEACSGDQRDLAAAIATDLGALDEGEAITLQGLFSLASGTRTAFIGGKLSNHDNLVFARSRMAALTLAREADADFTARLRAYLKQCATTRGGRAYLADLIPSIEMNAPGLLPNVAHTLAVHRGEYAFTTDDGLDLDQIRAIDLGAAEKSVAALAELASTDPIKPRALPAPSGGWNNDPYITYDARGQLHVFFQHNPFAASWNHIHWGHLVMSNGGIVNRPIALEPRPEDGYAHNFSGSILANKIPSPRDRSRLVTAAFFTAPGTGENGFVTFLQAPPTVMAVTADPALDTWQAERYTVTDANTYRDKIDAIHGDRVENRYDMRDPIVFRRDGKYFLLTAGTALPGRVGAGVIAILRPSDPDNLGKPWIYIGDMFRHPQRTLADGGPGILETPSLQRIGDKDVLVFGAQRKPSDGNLRGFGFHQGLQYFVGTFDAATGAFHPDSTEPGYFEHGRSIYAMTATAKPGSAGQATIQAWIRGFDELSVWNDRPRGWNGAITLPHTMTLVGGRPHVAPDEQLQHKLGRAWYRHASLAVSPGARTKTVIQDRTLDIRTQIALGAETTRATLAVLANRDGTGGIPISFDGHDVEILDETLPLFTTKTSSVHLEVIVDRSVVIVYADGKVLHKVINPPIQPGGAYASSVALASAGGPAAFTQFTAHTLN